MQLWYPCQILDIKKLIGFWSESVDPLKFTKTISNKYFSSKVGQHKRFSFGHVESNLLNLGEKVSPKPWQLAFNVPKSYQSNLYSSILIFLKSCSTGRMQFWQNGWKFSTKNPRLVEKFHKKLWFYSFWWLTAFHRLFFWTRRTLFCGNPPKSFREKSEYFLFKIRKEKSLQFFFRFFPSSNVPLDTLNLALTTLPKKLLQKNWKDFDLNPTNFEKLQTPWKTKVSHQNGQKRLSFVDVESSSHTRAESFSQKTWQFFAQIPENLNKQHFTHE